MRRVMIILSASAAFALLIWLLGGDKDKRAPKAPARQAAAAPKAQSRPDLSRLPPPSQGKQHIDPQLRALLLAAIAANRQPPKAHRQDAGPADAAREDATAPPKELSPLRKNLNFQRQTRKLLLPITRQCLKQNAINEPQAIGQDKWVEMNLQGRQALGTLVVSLKIMGPQGVIQAPAMQRCLEERAYGMRLPAPPIAPGKTRHDSQFRFPLFLPGGSHEEPTP